MPAGGEFCMPDDSRAEVGAPALVSVLGELKVVALAVHAHRDGTDARPRAQPAVESRKGWHRRRVVASREAQPGD